MRVAGYKWSVTAMRWPAQCSVMLVWTYTKSTLLLPLKYCSILKCVWNSVRRKNLAPKEAKPALLHNKWIFNKVICCSFKVEVVLWDLTCLMSIFYTNCVYCIIHSIKQYTAVHLSCSLSCKYSIQKSTGEWGSYLFLPYVLFIFRASWAWDSSF